MVDVCRLERRGDVRSYADGSAWLRSGPPLDVDHSLFRVARPVARWQGLFGWHPHRNSPSLPRELSEQRFCQFEVAKNDRQGGSRPLLQSCVLALSNLPSQQHNCLLMIDDLSLHVGEVECMGGCVLKRRAHAFL